MENAMHDDIALAMQAYGEANGTPVVFVTPNGEKFRAYQFVKPHGKNEIVVSLIAEEDERPRFNHPNTGMPLIELAPASDKHPCCGMLKIQAHMPDCQR